MTRSNSGGEPESSLLTEIRELRERIAELEADARAARITTQEASTMQDLLRASPEMRRLLMQFTVENLSDAAYWVQPDATIAYVNDAATRLLGYTKSELLSMRIHELDPDVPQPVWQELWDQLKSERKRTFETRHRTRDGALIPVEISANYMEFDGLEFSCAFARDIRDRLQLETRLRQAEKMEAVGQLAGGIAHDFNNQLMGIMGYADLLQRELGNTGVLSELVHSILRAVTRSAELTAQLLAFSRKGKYVSEPVDLHQLVDEVADILAHSVDKKITIRRELTADSPTILGDSSQLQSALLNMALNARDAMPNGGILTFSTANLVLGDDFQSEYGFSITPGPHVRICVADTGDGIAQDVQQRIFEPFFTTKSEGKGTGLGLAAVYGTVKNHRGAICVHSKPGQGTSLEVFLPVARETQVPKRNGDDDKRTSHPAHVLVIEDEAALRDVARRMLESLGYSVTTFESGDKAIRYYESLQDRVDLVILDMVMPVLNGRETYKALRGIDPNVKVLLASGYSLDGDAQAILDDGVMGFIQKPYTRAALAQKIGQILATTPAATRQNSTS